MAILSQHGNNCLNMKSARQRGRASWLGFPRSNERWYVEDDNTRIKNAMYGNWDKFTPVYPNLGCTFVQTDSYWSFRDKTMIHVNMMFLTS